MKTTTDIISIARAEGCLIQEQKKFTKITSPNPNGKAMYVARTKTTLTRVDISGWEPEAHPAIKPIPKGVNGAVRGQILPKAGLTPDQVEEGFRLCLSVLLDERKGFKFGA